MTCANRRVIASVQHQQGRTNVLTQHAGLCVRYSSMEAPNNRLHHASDPQAGNRESFANVALRQIQAETAKRLGALATDADGVLDSIKILERRAVR
jgi:hypothetical protein